jgi:WD40 repeat protein
MVGLAKWKLSVGAVCGALAALLIGNAARGEEAAKEVASVRQEHGAGAPEHEDAACASVLAFTPDGKLLMCAEKGGTDNLGLALGGVVCSYEVPSLKPKRNLAFGSRLSWFAFTTDGKKIVAAEDKAIVVRDTAGEDEPQTIKFPNPATPGQVGQVQVASLAADNRTVAAGVGHDIFVWDIVADKQVARFTTPMSNVTRLIAISPDGKSVASSSYGDAGLLWDVATGTLKKRLPTTAATPIMGALTWSAAGKLFAIADGGKMAPSAVYVWFGGSGSAKSVLPPGHEGGVTSMAFLPDGKTLVTGSMDNTVKVWDVSDATVKGTIKCANRVNAVAVSPDGKLIAVALAGDDNDKELKNLLLYNVSDVVK